MKRRLFILLRSLSVLVGLLIVIAPFVAKEDELLGILLAVTFGLVFVAYGLTGASAPPTIPLKLHLPSEALITLLSLVSGVIFLAKPGQRALNLFGGAACLLIVIASVWAAYAKRRSSPAA
jgi:uncharacterized membrane protein HdeD (DUF308 family)